jgi:hypothetical protein
VDASAGFALSDIPSRSAFVEVSESAEGAAESDWDLFLGCFFEVAMS